MRVTSLRWPAALAACSLAACGVFTSATSNAPSAADSGAPSDHDAAAPAGDGGATDGGARGPDAGPIACTGDAASLPPDSTAFRCNTMPGCFVFCDDFDGTGRETTPVLSGPVKEETASNVTAESPPRVLAVACGQSAGATYTGPVSAPWTMTFDVYVDSTLPDNAILARVSAGPMFSLAFAYHANGPSIVVGGSVTGSATVKSGGWVRVAVVEPTPSFTNVFIGTTEIAQPGTSAANPLALSLQCDVSGANGVAYFENVFASSQ